MPSRCSAADSAPPNPEDDTFVMRWWTDLQFMIVALRRLRRAAELGKRADA